MFIMSVVSCVPVNSQNSSNSCYNKSLHFRQIQSADTYLIPEHNSDYTLVEELIENWNRYFTLLTLLSSEELVSTYLTGLARSFGCSTRQIMPFTSSDTAIANRVV